MKLSIVFLVQYYLEAAEMWAIFVLYKVTNTQHQIRWQSMSNLCDTNSSRVGLRLLAFTSRT